MFLHIRNILFQTHLGGNAQSISLAASLNFSECMFAWDETQSHPQKALNVTVILHWPPFTHALWCEKTLRATFNSCKNLTLYFLSILLCLSSHQSRLCLQSLSPSSTPLPPSISVNQSPHEITRWHVQCCLGNHCYTTVAWPTSANKLQAQHRAGAAQTLNKASRKSNKSLEEGSGGRRVTRWLLQSTLYLI